MKNLLKEKAKKYAEKWFEGYPYHTHQALEDAYKAGWKACERKLRAEFEHSRTQAYIDDLRGL
jgi:hypothetical protein